MTSKTKQQIMQENEKRFLENAKKYAKILKLKLDESEIDIEKAKEITNTWYDKEFYKQKNLNIDAIIAKNRKNSLKKDSKRTLDELKYARPGSLKI